MIFRGAILTNFVYFLYLFFFVRLFLLVTPCKLFRCRYNVRPYEYDFVAFNVRAYTLLFQIFKIYMYVSSFVGIRNWSYKRMLV